MSFYEKAKDWLKQKENKDKLVLGLSFVLIFIVGFGAGSYVRETRRDGAKPQANYTTATAKKPAIPAATDQAQVLGKTTVTASGTPALACIVKGNISSAGKKIYHVKGGAFYDRTKAEECFNTEAEALAAGFVKSSR
jgi:hypothetical protein